MGVRAITFSGGGEPLLYKGLMETLESCRERGISTAILTNGVYLKQAILTVAMDSCSWIRISMDGWDRDSYADYRKCKPEDFDQLIENIKNAMSMQSECVLGVNIIVDHLNAAHVYDLVKIVHDLGVRSIKISPCIVSNDHEMNNHLHLKLRPIVQEQLDKLRDEGIEVYDSYHQQLCSFQKDYNWCPYIQVLPIIGADQNVYACHDKAYNKTNGMLGSIKDQSFKKFWFDGEEKFYKIDPSKHCNHHCMSDQTNKLLLEYLFVDHVEFV
jgi:MoaA/NifB/PqqE/SkfB family radical SAM enzyme